LEAVLTCFEVLPQNLPGEAEEHDTAQAELLVTMPSSVPSLMLPLQQPAHCNIAFTTAQHVLHSILSFMPAYY
jgi:hypothetical protein